MISEVVEQPLLDLFTGTYDGVYWHETRTMKYPGQDYTWDRNYAYYIHLPEPYFWTKTEPLLDPLPFTFTPKDAWDDSLDPNNGNGFDPYTLGWFFIGYAHPGYMKLGSVPIGPNVNNGDPANYDYVGPFHWLKWINDQQSYPHRGLNDQYLVIVKRDDGNMYIPDDPNYPQPPGTPPIDQIYNLEPGRGYFLGFRKRNVGINFPGWNNVMGWQNSIPPQPEPPLAQTASFGHFQYKKYTHWSYPVVIDTIDLAVCSLAVGDQIGVFDGDLCVGTAGYQDQFPLVITCWKDDIATPDSVDGYGEGNEMTFIWYDVSQNAEVEFQLPPTIQAIELNPVAPSHSGFGAGAYARRSFGGDVITTTHPLPQTFRLGQNFPNPFNAETVIPLELPQRSKVQVELFNIRGQSLGVVYDGIENAGWPKIRFEASRLASGIYFYRVQAEGLERGGRYTDVGKMVLLK
jgi:hypothetical protein